MAIDLERPTRIRLRMRYGSGSSAQAERRPARWVPPAIALALRLFLVGLAVGIFAITGSSLASIAFVGVIALGAALTGWDR